MSQAVVTALFWVSLGACGGYGAAGVIARVARKDDPEARRGPWLLAETGLALLVVALWCARFVVAGHIPIFGTYESAISLALCAVGASLIVHLRTGVATVAGPVAALVSATLLAHASQYDDRVFALTISERSWVVDVHSVFAWVAFGVLTVNAGLALATLLARRELSARQAALVPRTLELGFVLHSGMMLSGSLYKFLLFGNAWSFDPMETMGLTAWVAYGALVHMVRFGGWRGRRLAGWCLFLFVLLVVSYRIIVYFPAWSSYHILDIGLRMHITG